MSVLVRTFTWSAIVVVALAFQAVPSAAQEPAAAPVVEPDKGIEEIIVTSRKKEESIQDIPIAVSAFSADSLETANIEDVADIQFNVPNLSYSKTNFSGAGNISLRGVGNLATAASAENGTGIHINTAPAGGARIFEAEFFDVDRIEVLRGPQGTLFGRSAPAGTLNIFTKKPVLGEWGGYVDGTYGKYNHGELRGAVNIPLGEHFAARFAGYYFNRDGTTRNTYLDNHIDDRNVYALRGSIAGEWDMVDFHYMFQYFHEQDHRMRVNNQGCTRDNGAWPATIGCKGDESLGRDQQNDTSNYTFGLGLLADSFGFFGWPAPYHRHLTGPRGVINFLGPTSLANRLINVPPGFLPACNPNGCGLPTSPYQNSQRPDSLRAVSTHLTPQYGTEEMLTTLEVNFHLTDDITLSSVTGWSKNEVSSRTDYFWSASSETFQDGPAFFEFPESGRGPGKSLAGMYDQAFQFDRSWQDGDGFTQELRISTAFDGPLNVTAGVIYNEASGEGSYAVWGTEIEGFWDLPFDPMGSCSVDAAGNKVGLFLLGGGPAVAGPRVTGGSCNDIFPDTSYFWSKTLASFESYAIFGEAYWDIFEKTRLTVGARYTDDRKESIGQVNLFTCEVLSFTPGGSVECGKEPPDPTQVGGWTNVTWKVSLDQRFDLPFAPDSLVYATVSTGFKGGGFNPPLSCAQSGGGCASVSPTFDPEEILAYEIGYKGMLFERMLFNLSGFYYDYQGMQIGKIVSRTAINENVDSAIWGIEAETVMLLTDALTIDLNVSYLNTEIKEASSIDPANPTRGLPGWIAVKHDDLAGANAACFVATNPACLTPTLANGLPANSYFVDGIEGDLSGNELPGSPNWSVKVGAQYVLPIFAGWEMTPRVDYYWRDKSWGRIYNAPIDEIDSWQQVDVQLRFAKEGFPVTFELWGKNLQDNDDTTGTYFTDSTSSNFMNLFILEPRTYGISARYTWGESEL